MDRRCGEESHCNTPWSVAADEGHLDKLHDNIKHYGHQTKEALMNVSKKIIHDWEEATEKNEQQLMKMAGETFTEQRKVMIDWGCDAKCVNSCTKNFDNYFGYYKYCTMCECPSHFKITSH